MSVIIRLQNLPWSANALDIRQYFRGLSIPEGGVHIVGGEQGDAFIAFSTDEDARQAMMMDGGRIKEVKIKLMLSSRTEMQKVIEHARQQSISLHSFMQMPAPPIAPVHNSLSSLIGSLQATGVTSSVTTPPPSSLSNVDPSIIAAVSQQPPSISPVNSTNSGIGTVPTMGVGPLANNMQDRRDERKDLDSAAASKFKDRKERSRSREPDRRSDRRDRDRDRERHRERERDRRSSRRDRSRSRDRDRKRSSRRDRSRTKDRSRSRDRMSRDRGRSSARDVRRDSSLNRASHSDDDKDKENDVILVAQYPNKEAMAEANKAADVVSKQPVKPVDTPSTTSSAASKVSVTETRSGRWSDSSSHGQQGSFNKPPLMGPTEPPTSLSMSSMSGTSMSVTSMSGTPMRPMQMPVGGGMGMSLHGGSSFPGEMSRSVGNIGSIMGGIPDSMQGSFMRDMGFPISGRDMPGGGRGMPGSGRGMPGSGREMPGSGRGMPGSGREMPGGARDMPGSGREMPSGARQMPGGARDMPGGVRDMPGGARDMPGGGREMLVGGRDIPGGGRDMLVGGRDMPVGGRDMPVGGRDMSVGGRDMSVGGRDMPVGVRDMPGGGRDMLGSGRDIPSGGRDMPGSGRDMPGSGRDMPGGDRDIPGGGRDMPINSRDMSGVSREIPGSARDMQGQSSLHSRESWPPLRQPSDLMSRFGGRDRMGGSGSFPVKQDALRGSSGFNESLDEYDRDFDIAMSHGFRGGSSSYRGGGAMDYRRGLYSQSGDSRMAPRNLLGPSSLMDRTGGMPPQGSDMMDRRGGAGLGTGTYRNQFRSEPDYPHHRGGGDRFGMDPYERQYMNDRHFSGRPSSFPAERFPTRERFTPNDRTFDSRPQSVQSGLCVEIRHMPPETGIGDIRRFFQGMFISNNAVKIINDNHGNRVGIAYVKFAKLQDKEMAMHFTGKTIRGSIVEILHLEDDIFDKAIDSYRPPQETDMDIDSPESEDQQKLGAMNQYVCLSVHDLPPYVKEEDIFKLFQGYTVDEVVLAVSKGAKKEYEAYVKFSQHEDAKQALHSQVKHMIGHKVLTVKPCTVEELQEARTQQNGFEEEKVANSQEDPSVAENEPESDEQPPPESVPQDPSNHNDSEEVQPANEEPVKAPPPPAVSDCILLKGLPIQANDRDILDFFSDVGLVPLRIHIMLDKFGKATGDAFCEFSSLEEASRSLAKHAATLGKQEVNVVPITREDMNEALGMPAVQADPLVVGGGGNLRPPMLMGGGRNFGRTGLLGSSPASLSGRLSMMSGRGPMPQDNPVEGFGKPGCVLALENIPFKADIEEILEFFGDFDISRENVIRRFNERGFATGEARVAFTSPSEAQRALRELRNGRMRGRSIYMSPL